MLAHGTSDSNYYNRRVAGYRDQSIVPFSFNNQPWYKSIYVPTSATHEYGTIKLHPLCQVSVPSDSNEFVIHVLMTGRRRLSLCHGHGCIHPSANTCSCNSTSVLKIRLACFVSRTMDHLLIGAAPSSAGRTAEMELHLFFIRVLFMGHSKSAGDSCVAARRNKKTWPFQSPTGPSLHIESCRAHNSLGSSIGVFQSHAHECKGCKSHDGEKSDRHIPCLG